MIDKKFPHTTSISGGDLRPDILVEDPIKKEVHIVDIKCTIDLAASWSNANTLTDQKYSSITQYYTNQGYKKVSLNNFIISSLGSFAPQNWKILNAMGMGLSKIRYIADRTRRHAIHWSRNIWVTHCGSQTITF
jgi:hypothetical protein